MLFAYLSGYAKNSFKGEGGFSKIAIF